MFSTCLENFSAHFHHILNCLLQTLSVWKSLKFVVWERVKVLIFQPSIKEDLFFTGSNGTLPRPTPPPHPERFVFTLYAFVNELYNRLQNKLWFFSCLQYKSFEYTTFSTMFSELSVTFIKYEIVFCKLFQFGTV